MKTMACEQCGVEFTYKPNKKNPRRYCKRPCWKLAQAKRIVVDRPACSNCGEREARCKGYCLRCWKRQTSVHGMAGAPPRPTHCSICGAAPVVSKGWCGRHYWSFNRHNDPFEVDRRANQEPWIDEDGYLRGPGGVVHRLVMQEHLGRRLKRNEHVHHIDGDKLNNDLENLVVVVGGTSSHQAVHRSLELLAFDLVQRGVISFDKSLLTYALDPLHAKSLPPAVKRSYSYKTRSPRYGRSTEWTTERGLGDIQRLVLTALADEPQTVRRLSEHLSIPRGTVHLPVRRLEDRGLICRLRKEGREHVWGIAANPQD